MNFCKDLKSFELVTLIEKSTILKNKIKYILLFWIKYSIYIIEFKIKIRLSKNNRYNKIDLFIELYQEYFYLDELLKNLKIKNNISNLEYYMYQDNIISEIIYNYENNLYIIIKVEYDTVSKNSCIYIDTSHLKDNTRGFNITSEILSNCKEKDKFFNNFLKLFFTNILCIWLDVYGYYKEVKNGKINRDNE